jgi:hypothetical protein
MIIIYVRSNKNIDEFVKRLKIVNIKTLIVKIIW